MQILIHIFVAHYWKDFAILEFKRLIFLQDGLTVSIKLYSQGVNVLDSGHLNVSFVHVASSEIDQIRITETCVAQEQEHVAYPYQIQL